MLKQLLMMVKFPSGQGSPHWPRDGNETNDPTPGTPKDPEKASLLDG
jgi:hypothetical protein